MNLKTHLKIARSALKSLSEDYARLEDQADFLAGVEAQAPDHQELVRELKTLIEEEKQDIVINYIEKYLKK